MRFHRSRTQILYRYVPGALFEHDKYGICRVTDVAVTAPDHLNTDGLRGALQDYLTYWEGYGDDAFPDPFTEWQEYKVGVPERVSFDPFPTIVQCSNCGHINDLQELSRQPVGTKPVCTNCGKGKYRQLPYATIHNCGKLSLVPVVACPEHGKGNMRFIDTGRFVTAYWRCEKCGYTRGMPRYQCNCSYSRTIEPGNDFKKNMQYVRTNESSAFYSHTIPIVNLSEVSQIKLREDPRPSGLLLARLWGLIERNVFEVVEERAAAMVPHSRDAQARALLEELMEKFPNEDSLRLKYAEMYENPNRLPQDEEIDAIDNLLPGIVSIRPSQSLLEHIAIIDSLDIIQPDDAISTARRRQDNSGAFDLEQGIDFANRVLGIRWMGCITDFPIALASIGYSRRSKKPGDALLNPFRPERDGGKVPIYVVTSDTEAIMIQLSPQRVAQWLIENSLAYSSFPETELDSWIWCKRHLRHFADFRSIMNVPDDLSEAEKAVLTLLHSISHTLMKHIEWSGFDPESVGEYLLPETLSVIIHSNNYNSFTIGGMVTLFEQRLHGWLREAYNASFSCVYDPICRDEGASCVGCLHRQHNCEGFNRFLSRSILHGGVCSDLMEPIQRGYWDFADAY